MSTSFVACFVYDAREGSAVASNVPELEQRISNLQSQVERLQEKAEETVQPIEQRLARMADGYAQHLQQWVSTAERHRLAVAELESYVHEWNEASNRAHQDTARRLQELQSAIQHEWDSLRTVHEQPARELRDQAATLTDICIATASVAQQGFDQSEARLASIEGEFHRLFGELTRELHSAVAEIRGRSEHQPARLEGGGQWSLDDVTRLHSRLRDPGGQLHDRADVASPVGTGVMNPSGGAVVRELPPAIAAEVEELRRLRARPTPPESGAPRIISDAQPVAETARPWKVRLAAVGLGVALLAAVGFGWYVQSQVRAATGRAQQAELQSQKAADAAARQAAAAREDASREIANAREMADRAERIGNVLAAPDLIRYNLASGTGAPGASGQALWSRSRGFVFSGNRIAPPPENSAYQVWLLTRVAPVKAATFVPEPDGTVTLVEQVVNVQRAVVGVMVTAEPAGGGDSPSGELILTSVLPAAQ